MNNHASALNVGVSLIDPVTEVDEMTYQLEKSLITWSPGRRRQARSCDPSDVSLHDSHQQDPDMDTGYMKSISIRQSAVYKQSTSSECLINCYEYHNIPLICTNIHYQQSNRLCELVIINIFDCSYSTMNTEYS